MSDDTNPWRTAAREARAEAKALRADLAAARGLAADLIKLAEAAWDEAGRAVSMQAHGWLEDLTRKMWARRDAAQGQPGPAPEQAAKVEDDVCDYCNGYGKETDSWSPDCHKCHGSGTSTPAPAPQADIIDRAGPGADLAAPAPQADVQDPADLLDANEAEQRAEIEALDRHLEQVRAEESGSMACPMCQRGEVCADSPAPAPGAAIGQDANSADAALRATRPAQAPPADPWALLEAVVTKVCKGLWCDAEQSQVLAQAEAALAARKGGDRG